MGKGRRNENRLVNLINRETPSYIDAMANGYSGSHATCCSDILVRTPTIDHAIEAKNYGWSTGQRKYILKKDDLEDGADSVNRYTQSWFVIDWSNRELLVLGPIVKQTVDGVAQRVLDLLPNDVNPSYTGDGHIMGEKPSTETMSSASKGRDDIEVLAEKLYLDRVQEE